MFQEAEDSTVKQHNPSPKIMTFYFHLKEGATQARFGYECAYKTNNTPPIPMQQYSSNTLHYWQNYTQTFDQIFPFVEKSSRQSCILKLDLEVNLGKCYGGGTWKEWETNSYHVSTKFTTEKKGIYITKMVYFDTRIM